MLRHFFRFFLLFLTLTVQLTFAATDPSSQGEQKQTQQTQEPTQEGETFFDKVDAPVTYKGAFTKMILTLLGLIVLIVITVWMLRRISHGRIKQMNYGKAIKVLERRPLSAKSVLYLVEISGKKVVVAESQVEIRAITTADHLSPEE